VLKPQEAGGQSEHSGTVEVVLCMEKDGRWTFNHLRWGVYVVTKAPGEYQRECFQQYGLKTDESGLYAARYKPYHLIGLELGVAVATIMTRGEPTGQTKTWAGDIVATAKRDLEAGETLDGEGGFMVYGKLMPAAASIAIQGLPIGLAHGIVLKRDVKKD
jgi:predicted homoserine dehydrogenase-like protein